MEMSALELAAAVLVLVNIALVARRSIWNYPFGIAAVTLYAIVFWGARLYSDMLLQGFYLLLNLYGWWHWQRSRAASGEVVVLRLGALARIGWIAAAAAATLGWGALMHRFTDAAAPWWDASVAMISIAAQILMARRFVENWVLWILVDLIAIPLFAARGLWTTAAVYVLLLGLSLWGLIDWLRAERRAR